MVLVFYHFCDKCWFRIFLIDIFCLVVQTDYAGPQSFFVPRGGLYRIVLDPRLYIGQKT